jgi:hypothetical protein
MTATAPTHATLPACGIADSLLERALVYVTPAVLRQVHRPTRGPQGSRNTH